MPRRWCPPGVRFSHATNSQASLTEAIAEGVHMIEADVLLSDTGTIILAHPPCLTSDLTLRSLLERLVAFNTTNPRDAIGLKLDFKNPSVVAASIDLTKTLWVGMKAPVWLNADVLIGPGRKLCAFDAHDFVQTCVTKMPAATLSLGWTTCSLHIETNYTHADVTAMLQLCEQHQLKGVTFAVAASYAEFSGTMVERLLAQPQSTITFWGKSDNITADFIKKLDPTRVHIDTKESTWMLRVWMGVCRLLM
eukprot:m.212213 g.212213  ORF g.212213 m.212213 type:complete len:250 (-) comp33120_c6_seq1:137-886(-)